MGGRRERGGGHVGVERALVLFTVQPGAENKEAIRRSEPVIIRWQPTEAVEQVFVRLVFFLRTIIKATWHHQFSCHDYLHANLTSSVWRQIISSLIWSKANCHYFLKKTLLFMRKLLSANWVFHEFSPGNQTESCFYYLLPLYNQLFIGDDSFQPRKSNVFVFLFFFFFLGKAWQTEGKKNVELSLGLKKSFGFAIFPTHIHACIQICSPICRQGAATSLRAVDLCETSCSVREVQKDIEKRFFGAWSGETGEEICSNKHRTDGNIIASNSLY